MDTSTLTEMERALEENPFDLALREDVALAHLRAGGTDKALQHLRIRLKQGKTARALLAAALAETRQDNIQAARPFAEQAALEADYKAALEAFHEDERSALRELLPERPLRLVHGGAPPAEGKVLSIHRSETVRFADIAGMDELKKLLRLRIIEPFLRPGLFERFKKRAGGGVLLYGPPGCGKTMIARAIATECKASFTAIGISDVLSMWIGQSEGNLAEVFDKARGDRPAVLFFDELDALAYSRSKANSDHTRTVVNEFLSQLDGAGARNEGVLVMGATNMPWDVDEAMKRPGRFDRQVFVPPPDAAARLAMLKMKLLDVPTQGIELSAIAQRTEGFSGADIDGLIDVAKESALVREIESEATSTLGQADFELALADSSPTTVDWFKTARNLIKFGGARQTYKDVEAYLRATKQYN